uniref:Uncharacterized protein n=1 Tax=Oryza nivara TaxID=4536 RepID=A0A679BDT9_ORYNI|nr:hypothetical protein [Oryza sativa f. spontanea]
MYLSAKRVSSAQKPLLGTGGVNEADKREELEVEGDIALHLAQLVSLLPTHEAAVQVAAVLTGQDEHVYEGVSERLLQLLHRVPRFLMLHKLCSLEPIQQDNSAYRALATKDKDCRLVAFRRTPLAHLVSTKLQRSEDVKPPFRDVDGDDDGPSQTVLRSLTDDDVQLRCGAREHEANDDG